LVLSFLQGGSGNLLPGQTTLVLNHVTDPLTHIGGARAIHGVVRAGEWIGREKLDGLLAEVAAEIRSPSGTASPDRLP